MTTENHKGMDNATFYEFILSNAGEPSSIHFEEGLLHCVGPFTKIPCERQCELLAEFKRRHGNEPASLS